MKNSKKLLTVVICLALLLSFPLAVYAGSSTFFIKTCNGYSCSGRGSLSGTVGTATLSASEIDGTAHVPSDECYSVVVVKAYNSAGTCIGYTETTGSTYTTATYTNSNSSTSISWIGCTFTFNGTSLGAYTQK